MVTMQRQFQGFVIRWILNSIGLWVAVKLFGTGYTETPEGVFVFLIAGFIFSIVNVTIKPIIVVLSLPALLITLGLFMFIVNGFMVYVSLKLAPGLSMTFWNSVLTGIVISLVNYIVSNVVDLHGSRLSEETK